MLDFSSHYGVTIDCKFTFRSASIQLNQSIEPSPHLMFFFFVNLFYLNLHHNTKEKICCYCRYIFSSNLIQLPYAQFEAGELEQIVCFLE